MTQTTQIQGLIAVNQRLVQIMLESGHFLIELDKQREAEEVFNGLAALLPQSAVPLLSLGNLYWLEGRDKKAIQAYEDALKRDAQCAEAYAYLAEVHAFCGAKEQAKECIAKAKSLGAGTPAADFATAIEQGLEQQAFDAL